jgi:small subunit ribosomal protein S3Ae
MAVGKNKRLSKGGKKSQQKRKVADFMTKKEWYDVVAPTSFTKRSICKTLVNKSVGNKSCVDGLKGRVFELNLGDLNEDEQQSHRNIRLRVDDVSGRSCLTNFHGMSLTTDKMRSLVRKWCTLIQAIKEVKTSDGFLLRVFVIGFTKRQPNQVKKNCHAKSSQVRKIRKKIFGILNEAITKSDLQSCVKKFQLETIGKDIEYAVRRIFPLRDVHIYKVKVLRMPKFDPNKLLEVHGNEIPPSLEEMGVEIPVQAAPVVEAE